MIQITDRHRRHVRQLPADPFDQGEVAVRRCTEFDDEDGRATTLEHSPKRFGLPRLAQGPAFRRRQRPKLIGESTVSFVDDDLRMEHKCNYEGNNSFTASRSSSSSLRVASNLALPKASTFKP